METRGWRAVLEGGKRVVGTCVCSVSDVLDQKDSLRATDVTLARRNIDSSMETLKNRARRGPGKRPAQFEMKKLRPRKGRSPSTELVSELE